MAELYRKSIILEKIGSHVLIVTGSMYQTGKTLDFVIKIKCVQLKVLLAFYFFLFSLWFFNC